MKDTIEQMPRDCDSVIDHDQPVDLAQMDIAQCPTHDSKSAAITQWYKHDRDCLSGIFRRLQQLLKFIAVHRNTDGRYLDASPGRSGELADKRAVSRTERTAKIESGVHHSYATVVTPAVYLARAKRCCEQVLTYRRLGERVPHDPPA
jgi:hypothetical protein